MKYSKEIATHIQEAHETWRRLKRRKTAVFGLGAFIIFIMVAILAPFIAPFSPYERAGPGLAPPSAQFILGTDDLGRDILSRIVYGSRITLIVGVISVAIAAILGVLAGIVSGYYGGKLDSIVMRATDIMLAFPPILFALVIITVTGHNIYNLMIAVGITSVPRYARLIRGLVLTVKESDYVEAARAAGSSDLRILFRHILPNILPAVIVLSTITMPAAVLWAASLSFIGLGAQPPEPEWGKMVSDGRRFITFAWWPSTAPGIAIFFFVMGLNLLGDGLRDALDPRMRV